MTRKLLALIVGCSFVLSFVSLSEETDAKWKVPKQVRIGKVKVPKQLRIDKVYVPKKLKIGKAKGIWEVIIPYCWGSPQDCRGVTGKVTYGGGQPAPYYVTTRFLCRDKKLTITMARSAKSRSGQTCRVLMQWMHSELLRIKLILASTVIP